jgi:hypothetical protein
MFQVDIGKPMDAVIRRHLEAAKERTKEDSIAFEVDVPFRSSGPTPILSPDERFAADSFQAFMEVGETLQRLLDIELYVRRFPFRETRVTRERYIRFHIEAYFHEVYILRERLLTLAKRTTRAYKKTDRRALAFDVEGRIRTIHSALDDVIAVRSRHVHEQRFDETRLRNLGAIELIERNSTDPIWTSFLGEQYPKVRKYWVGWVKEMNAVVQQLLDGYFGELHRLMFDERRFRPPNAIA